MSLDRHPLSLRHVIYQPPSQFLSLLVLRRLAPLSSSPPQTYHRQKIVFMVYKSPVDWGERPDAEVCNALLWLHLNSHIQSPPVASSPMTVYFLLRNPCSYTSTLPSSGSAARWVCAALLPAYSRWRPGSGRVFAVAPSRETLDSSNEQLWRGDSSAAWLKPSENCAAAV